MSRFYKSKKEYMMNDGEIITIYFTKNVFNCGVSLGDYILLDYDVYGNRDLKEVANHEHGHQKQSRIFGPLYLILVGFVSAICNNLWNRIAHKKWDNLKRIKWYYNRYPENWADRLGLVVRNY